MAHDSLCRANVENRLFKGEDRGARQFFDKIFLCVDRNMAEPVSSPFKSIRSYNRGESFCRNLEITWHRNVIKIYGVRFTPVWAVSLMRNKFLFAITLGIISFLWRFKHWRRRLHFTFKNSNLISQLILISCSFPSQFPFHFHSEIFRMNDQSWPISFETFKLDDKSRYNFYCTHSSLTDDF